MNGSQDWSQQKRIKAPVPDWLAMCQARANFSQLFPRSLVPSAATSEPLLLTGLSWLKDAAEISASPVQKPAFWFPCHAIRGPDYLRVTT